VAIAGMNPSPISPSSSYSYAVMKKNIEEQFTDVFVAPVICIGATDARHYSSLCKNLYRFIPVVIDNDDKEMIHGYNERISLTALDKAMSFYYELVRKMDKPQ
jgi:carboxypeptidase PM20D1